MSKASTIETCLYRRENGPKNWKRRFLTWKAVFFQVPVTFCRSISGCNYFAPGLCIDEPSRGYSFMFEQLRVSDRFGISDMSIFWSFLIWGTCLSVQDVCRFFFFFRDFFLFHLISPGLKPNSLWSFFYFFWSINLLWSLLHFCRCYLLPWLSILGLPGATKHHGFMVCCWFWSSFCHFGGRW